MVSEEFARAVREEVEKMLPEDRKGATIWTENILKDADRTLTGLCVREKGASEYPRVYLEDFEKALLYGQTFSSVMRDIMDALEENRQMQQLSNTARDVTRDPEEARRRVSYRILNYGRNIQNITTRPYRVQGEFVYVYSLTLGNGGRIPIDKNLADKLDLKEPELYELARKNSPVVTPAEVLTIGQALGFPGQHPARRRRGGGAVSGSGCPAEGTLRRGLLRAALLGARGAGGAPGAGTSACPGGDGAQRQRKRRHAS